MPTASSLRPHEPKDDEVRGPISGTNTDDVSHRQTTGFSTALSKLGGHYGGAYHLGVPRHLLAAKHRSARRRGRRSDLRSAEYHELCACKQYIVLREDSVRGIGCGYLIRPDNLPFGVALIRRVECHGLVPDAAVLGQATDLASSPSSHS